MLLTDQNPFNKSLMASVLGVPNAGKSSLINNLLGFDLSIVSIRPQTTRNRFHCAFTVDHTEIVLVDTPGLHSSTQEINVRMNEAARECVHGVDLNLLLLDLSGDLIEQFRTIRKELRAPLSKTWIIFTKSDLVSNWKEMPLTFLVEHLQKEEANIERYFAVSSHSGDNIHELTGALCDAAQSGPHLYPRGEVSNKNERFFASEYIREQAFKILQEELPYEIAVSIDEFKDQKPRIDEPELNGPHDFRQKRNDSRNRNQNQTQSKLTCYISASILVNRPSQRAIVVGSGGRVIKEIGMKARKKIEAMVGGQVHLNLHVKVAPKWFKNNRILEELGLPRAQESKRVWRDQS